MKETCSSSRGVGGGRIKFAGAIKCSVDGKELNTGTKINNTSKANATDDSDSEDEFQYFTFEKPKIRAESDSEQEHGCQEQLDKTKLCVKLTMD